MLKRKYGICGLCFHSPGCGVIIHFDENNKIDHLEPDPDSPLGSKLCPIAGSAKEIVYSETRLTHPLKRVGPKGTYKFEKISWDRAFDTIAHKLNSLKDSFGPECVAFYSGTGSYERSLKDIFQLKGSEIYLSSSVLFPFGSPNTFGVGSPCYTSLGVLAPKLTMGCLHIDMFSDVDNSDLILIWGTDPSTSTPPEMYEHVKKASRRGAGIVVIDPRRTSAASLKGSEWIPIRPGTDGALALGLAHILIRDRLYDREFTREWTLGFEEFAAYVKAFNPEHVSYITGIDKRRIEGLAKSISCARGASYIMYTGLEYTRTGVQSIRAAQILWALAGHMDVPGGQCFLERGHNIPLAGARRVETPGYDKSIAKGRFPVYSRFCGGEPHASLLPKAIIDGDPYKIRAMFILGASLLTSWPSPGIWRKALNALDFLVTINLQLTGDAAYADLVLPAATGFEQESYCYYGNALRLREKMIDPVGDARSGYDIIAELALRLGYGHLYPQTKKELLEYILSDSRFMLNDLMNADKNVLRNGRSKREYKKWEKGLLRKDGMPGFETPSAKFEIKSTILENYGYEGLPKYEESYETPLSNPGMYLEYPLVLGTGPFKPDMKSCLRAIPAFKAKFPGPVVQINQIDAGERGIKNGDKVVVKTARGSVVMMAFVTDSIMKGVVYAPVGGGGPLGTREWREANVNELTDHEQFDPISGFPIYKTLLCEVENPRINH